MTGPRMALFARTGILPMEEATVWAAVLDHLDGWRWGEIEVINTDADATSVELSRLVCSNRLVWEMPNRYDEAGRVRERPPPRPKRRGRGFTKAPHRKRH